MKKLLIGLLVVGSFSSFATEWKRFDYPKVRGKMISPSSALDYCLYRNYDEVDWYQTIIDDKIYHGDFVEINKIGEITRVVTSDEFLFIVYCKR